MLLSYRARPLRSQIPFLSTSTRFASNSFKTTAYVLTLEVAASKVQSLRKACDAVARRESVTVAVPTGAEALNPTSPKTPNPKPQTLNPKPKTLNPCQWPKQALRPTDHVGSPKAPVVQEYLGLMV